MPKLKRRTTTGLRRGDAAKIARVHKCADVHVRLVAMGIRDGRDALVETIKRYQEKAERSAARAVAS